MSKTVEYYFDFGSPAAYLASTQLKTLALDTGATVVWRPMLLGGVFMATGNASPASVPAKGNYIFRDFARFARRYKVPLNTNPFFPINTITLMRIAIGLQLREDPRFADYCTAMFRAIWVEAHNMNDPAPKRFRFGPLRINTIGSVGNAVLAISIRVVALHRKIRADNSRQHH